jgi:NAD(P)-dependent dehydrogenase (short-subunit alcohol dehydrogenase family)
MQARESGTIAFTTSGAAFAPVVAAPGEGGWWSLAYAVSKAGLHRVAEQLRVEHRSLRFLNLDPGAVATEKVLAGATGEFEFIAKAAAPVDAIGDACARILASPRKLFRNGSTVDVQATARLWGLLPV